MHTTASMCCHDSFSPSPTTYEQHSIHSSLAKGECAHFQVLVDIGSELSQIFGGPQVHQDLTVTVWAHRDHVTRGALAEVHLEAGLLISRRMAAVSLVLEVTAGTDAPVSLSHPASVSSCCSNTLPHRNIASNDKNLLCYSSRGELSQIGLTGLKSRCRQGLVSSEVSGKESVSLPFLALSNHPHSLA